MTGLALATVTRQGRSKTPILAMLDEMPALGYMRPIEEGIGYLAGYNVKLWMFVQDLDQLEKTYPKARSMIANCAVRQAFNVQDPVTAKMLSEMLGTKTVRAQSSGSTSPLPISLFGTSFSAGQSDGARPLMTPDEIMTMSQDDQLIFVQGLRGIRATKLRFYSWRELRLRQRADRLAA
jgi:type IV secretion system protein VirD4